MKELLEKMSELCNVILRETPKAETTKAAAARIRKATLELNKVGKEFRRASIAANKK